VTLLICVCKCNCYKTGNYTISGDGHIIVIAEQLTGDPRDPVCIPFSETIGKEYGSVHFPPYPDNMAKILPEGHVIPLLAG